MSSFPSRREGKSAGGREGCQAPSCREGRGLALAGGAGRRVVSSFNARRSMKKDDEADDLLPEYDFHQMPGGVRGKLAAAYRRGTNLARLDPDVAQAFTTDESVNEALRAVLRAAAAIPTPVPSAK